MKGEQRRAYLDFLLSFELMFLILGCAVYLGGTTEFARLIGLFIGSFFTGAILMQIAFYLLERSAAESTV